MTNKDTSKPEVVLKLGVEGGGATIYRVQRTSGLWQFYVKGGSMLVIDDDEGGIVEAWDSWTEEPLPSLQDALRSLSADGEWIFF